MNTKVIVLKEIPLKEEDKIVVVFSREYGKISVYAKGARKTKSAFLAGTQMLTYSDFSIYKKDNISNLSKIEMLDAFMDIKNDYDKLYYAIYFCELIDSLTIEDNPSSSMFDFFVFTLEKMKKYKDMKFMKSIFELRMMSLSGYTPNVISCQECDRELDEDAFFLVNEDGIVCSNCNMKNKGIKISRTTLYTLKYIFYAKMDKLFSFDIEDKYKEEIYKVTNDFRNKIIGKPLKSEKFII